MPETEAILQHDVHGGRWAVPVPEGRTAEDVAEAWADSGWSLLRTADADDPIDSDPDTDYPSASAAKGVWVEFAVAHGMGADEANDHTRDQLADLYLPAEPAND